MGVLADQSSKLGHYLTPGYDLNGNLTSDGVHTYTWDSDGNMAKVDSSDVTYDALDRVVEVLAGTYTQVVYDPLGNKLALMSGQTLTKAFVGLPGGATAVYDSNGLAYYRHSDWLGSVRLDSTTSRTVYYDGAYAAYGENYAETGTQDREFAGMEQDIVSSGSYPLYDALMREYHPTWGRWLSPDPAGLAAASPANPQSWNRYAYVVNNPLILTDPLGLGPGDPCTVNPDGTVTCPPTTVTVNGNDSNMNAGGGGASGGSGRGGMSDAGGTNFHCPPYLGRGRDCLAPPSPIATLPLSTLNVKALVALVKSCSAQAMAFISANGAAAEQISQSTGISATDLLGLSALESDFGRSNLAVNYNNYFGLTVGSAFNGTTGVYTTSDGRSFGIYPSPGFLTSGLSFAQSFQGRRVTGVTDPAAFALRLTTPPLAFNSEPGYADKLVSRIYQVSACQ